MHTESNYNLLNYLEVALLHKLSDSDLQSDQQTNHQKQAKIYIEKQHHSLTQEAFVYLLNPNTLSSVFQLLHKSCLSSWAL